MMENILVFDIETIPDTQLGKKLFNIESNDEGAIAQAMFEKRREETNNGSDFLPLHFHRIVAISLVLKARDTFKIWSLGDETSSEKDLIERFFNGIEKYRPILVSWNGKGFDMPVIHYRALLHGVVAPEYWKLEDEFDRDFKWNNYLNRYHMRHTDLMDVLSNYQSRAVAKLDEIAVMLGFPGKITLDGSQVWPSYQAGKLANIRDYCETDVLNTYLIYLRFRFIQGKLDESDYDALLIEARQFLQNSQKPHLLEFLSAW